jgi:hypothetical protein
MNMMEQNRHQEMSRFGQLCRPKSTASLFIIVFAHPIYDICLQL